MDKRLFRSTENKIIGGVCGGLGEYFELDPVIIRLILVLLAISTTGSVILAYIVAWIIVPERPADLEPARQDYSASGWTRYWPGLVLILIGIIILLQEHWFWFSWSDVWPALLILLGLILIFRRGRSVRSDKEAVNHNGTQPGGNSL